jgi:hypothetical protein
MGSAPTETLASVVASFGDHVFTLMVVQRPMVESGLPMEARPGQESTDLVVCHDVSGLHFPMTTDMILKYMGIK